MHQSQNDLNGILKILIFLTASYVRLQNFCYIESYELNTK